MQCQTHPQQESHLSCSQCKRRLCALCLWQNEIGIRCQECQCKPDNQSSNQHSALIYIFLTVSMILLAPFLLLPGMVLSVYYAYSQDVSNRIMLFLGMSYWGFISLFLIPVLAFDRNQDVVELTSSSIRALLALGLTVLCFSLYKRPAQIVHDQLLSKNKSLAALVIITSAVAAISLLLIFSLILLLYTL